MKKVLCIIGAIIIVLIACIIVTKVIPKGYLTNDGEGTAEFERLSYEAGFGLDIDAGEFPMNVELSKGKLNIKIVKGQDTFFEVTDITESQEIVANIPETGYYIIMLSGKRAEGKIKYPVSESSNTPDIDGIDLNTDSNVPNVVSDNLDLESDNNTPEKLIVKNVIENHYKDNFDGEVEKVKFNSIKIYTKEEIENNELLKELNLNEKDVPFEINYELKIKEGTEDLMKYTAATGNIDGQWIKEKYNCGVAKFDSENSTYSLSNFGTGF